MSGSRIVWHYTTVDRFLKILEDGVIRPATAAVPEHERPVVWFSINEYWEQTANKMVRADDGRLVGLDMEGTAKLAGGLIRIGVEELRAPHSWAEIRRLAGIREKDAEALERVARADGADPAEWRGTLEAVSRDDWSRVETFQDGEWIEVDLGLAGAELVLPGGRWTIDVDMEGRGTTWKSVVICPL